MNLKSVAVASIKFSPPADNPNYRPPDVLPGIEGTGSALDVSAWKCHQPVKITRAGAQQLERAHLEGVLPKWLFLKIRDQEV